MLERTSLFFGWHLHLNELSISEEGKCCDMFNCGCTTCQSFGFFSLIQMIIKAIFNFAQKLAEPCNNNTCVELKKNKVPSRRQRHDNDRQSKNEILVLTACDLSIAPSGTTSERLLKIRLDTTIVKGDITFNVGSHRPISNI